MDFLIDLLWGVAPVFGGIGLYYVAGKCRGRNAKRAFTFAAWGTWLLMLWHIQALLPFFFLNFIVVLVPSAICYLLAANAMVKEMRAQKVGDYTDAA